MFATSSLMNPPAVQEETSSRRVNPNLREIPKTLSMASTPPDDRQTSKKVDEINDTQTDSNDVDHFQDASESPDQAGPSATQEQQGDSNQDAEAEAEDPNDESQMTESSYFPEDPIEDKDNDDDDVEERRRHQTGRKRRLAEFSLGFRPSFNPDVLPEQQEIQDRYLEDVLYMLHPDLANNSDEYRQELVKRGVAEDLIKQQEEQLAFHNANRHATAETSEWQTSPSAGNDVENAAWNATLPVRFPQQEQDPKGDHSHDLVRNEHPAESQEPVEHQREISGHQGPVPLLYASVRMPISMLLVVSESGETLYRYSQSELVRTEIDPRTHVLRVETRRPS